MRLHRTEEPKRRVKKQTLKHRLLNSRCNLKKKKKKKTDIVYNIWEERVRALFSQFCTLLVCIFQRVFEWLRGKDGGFEVRPPGGFSAWQFYFFSCLYLNICLFAAPAPKTLPTAPAMSDSLFFQLFFFFTPRFSGNCGAQRAVKTKNMAKFGSGRSPCEFMVHCLGISRMYGIHTQIPHNRYNHGCSRVFLLSRR